MARSWTLAQRAWAAGLFEGEGTTWISTAAMTPCSAVVMTDEDRVWLFHEVVGIGHVYIDKRKKAKPHHKQKWTWRANTFEQVQMLACLIWPWLGPRRREQFRRALRVFVEKPRKLDIWKNRGLTETQKRQRKRRLDREGEARRRGYPIRRPGEGQAELA